ncbi:hypothetical protein LDO26_03490 [Luteimonas sp. BDR2-5]|uniref:alpha-2-macroglobulin family protein n=1 Tax=Proluteimonas luteida TaxID=2878685 RepID=UPI001E65C7E2|nr:alpha-2-macroglobulin family protein [Luteimonas sp. BDR2-5]MCD9027278.1 hypothetical protein [Luteimonas sp. BDR2-5]
MGRTGTLDVTREGACAVRRHAVATLGFALLSNALLWGAAAPVAAQADAAAAVEARFMYDRSLQLRFPAAMQVWDNSVERQAVRLQPALPATCSWASDTQLDCRFDGAGPALATRYRIEVAGLRTQRGDAWPATTVHVETARPQLMLRQQGWVDGMPSLQLWSNVPSTADAVAQVLRVTVDGVPVAVDPAWVRRRDDGAGYGMSFDLALPPIAGRDRRLALAVVPGLRSSAGPLPGTQARTLLDALVNETFRLRGGHCSGRHGVAAAEVADGALALDCLAGEPVELAFSRPLDGAARRRFVASLPATAEFLGWGHGQWRQLPRDALAMQPGDHARLRIRAPDADVAFALPADLRTDGDATPVAPVRIVLRAGPFPPMLQAARSHALVADGRAPPVLARLYNAAPVEIDEATLAGDARTARFHTAEARGADRQPLSSPSALAALAAGGWVQWMPAPASRHAQPMEFAAPGFDLAAVAGRREVLAWANAWDADAPVAGARVELLWRERADAQPRVVAQARTGADGVARLRLPDDVALPTRDVRAGSSPMWLLRATHGRGRQLQRAVLPAWRQWQHDVRLGEDAPVRTWGVSDRPLYRAGDSVQYRLWQRQRSGGRLLRLDPAQRGPRELQLFELDRGKTILRWTATPDADAGFAGTLPLPVHLTDGTYCIGRGDAPDARAQGACFFVGTYRAQDLWAGATADAARVLRDGDTFAVDFEAGYYSGGPAAGIALSQVSTRLTPLPLQQAYPQYSEYTFVDVFDGDSDAVVLADADAPPPATDADGRARIARPVAFTASGDDALPPAFGELRLVAEIRPDDREATASNAATARYSRFDRFVGLQVAPRRLDARTPVTLQGVVIDADGQVQAGAPIEVEVQYLPGFAADAAPQALARCMVPAGEAAACEFARARPGRYRLLARSGDAAPAEVVRYVWGDGGHDTAAAAVEPGLELVEAPDSAGAPAHVLLRQPHARVRVLFVFASGDAIVGHRVETVDGNVAGIGLPTDPAWRGTPTLHAFVRNAAPAAVQDGWRSPAPLLELDVELPLPQSGPAAPLELAFDAPTAAPGQARTLVLRNTGDAPRDVALAVVDDALRALAADYLSYTDPQGPQWLGRDWRWQERLGSASFADWASSSPWTRRLPWRDGDPAPDEDCAAYVDAAAQARCEVPVMFDDAYAAGAPAPPAPPAPAMDIGASVEGGASLDRVQVTGSRIDPEKAQGEGAQPPHAPHEQPPSLQAPGDPLYALARLRTRFADTALWLPVLRLAPGETREIALALPDNLTRWRAVAWSSDADDGFHVAEATLEAGLPLEVRLQTPVRLYPGDRARLAANLRQGSDTPLDATAELRVDGLAPPAQATSTVALAARGQAGIALEIAPAAPGGLRAVAAADSSVGGDAVAADIEVASPTIRGRRLQAGWLGEAPLALDLPQLPDGAHDARLHIALVHGIDGLVERWTGDLRVYPHRCWEQILSRAVAAALAIERGDTADWPEAQAAVDEALANAAVFQDGSGGFRFFADDDGAIRNASRPPVALTAYSLQALDLLRELGHPVDAELVARATGALERTLQRPVDRADAAAVNEMALAAAAVPSADPALLDALRLRWAELAMPARLALTGAMARAGHPALADTTATLLAQAPARGETRVLQAGSGLDRWMGSPMREQCALIGLLRTHPGESATRRALIAGLSDLYGGGVSAVDTQTGATCLLALRDLAGRRGASEVALAIDGDDGTTTRLALAPGEVRSDWQGPVPAGRSLRLTPQGSGATPAGYIAEVDYLEDARQARESAVGFSILRRYEVLRDGAWAGIDGLRLRDGDWLRVILAVRTAAPRHYVAVTDVVPGGLRPTDLALGALAGLDLERVSGTGSHWFGTRRLDPRTPRFYAEYLPPGEHVLHYFARVGNTGDYLAAPATAELMYGGASNARTAAQRIVIDADAR